MARIQCAACGGRTEEGAFCEKCGAPMGGTPGAGGGDAIGVAGQAAGAYPSREPSPLGVSLGDIPTRGPEVVRAAASREPRVVVLATEDRGGTAGQPPAEGCPKAGTGGGACALGDCPWLGLERDTMAFCVAEAYGLLRLRVSVYASDVEDVGVSLCLNGMGAPVRQTVSWPRPKLGQSREFKLHIPPLHQGAHPAEIQIRFTQGGKVLTFDANTELYVYPPDSSVKQIAEHIVFNITNDIKTGHASDVHLSQNAADAVGRFTSNGSAHSVTDLLNLMNSEQRAYRREELYEAGCVLVAPSLGQPPAGSLAQQMTLEVGGRRAHLIAGNRVTLGKNRSSRIVTRVFDRAGKVSAQACERLSRLHSTLELNGEECVVWDGALDECGLMKTSTWGVFWQGKAVDGCVRFPAERFPASATLGLAGRADAHDFALRAQAVFPDVSRCGACGRREKPICRHGKTPCVVLKRDDAIPECYVLLWSCLDLGQVFPECAGLVVCHEQGAFSWRSSGAAGWLTPGHFVSAGTDLSVRSFAQVGL